MKSSIRKAILRAIYRTATTSDPVATLEDTLNAAFDEKATIVQSGNSQRVRTSTSRAGTSTTYSLLGESLGVSELELFQLYSTLLELYEIYSTGDYDGDNDETIYNNMMEDPIMNGVSYFVRNFDSNSY